jgi:RNA-directed DNA polymerase
LGFHIQRRRRKGTNTWTVYTYPSKKALLSILGKVRALTRRSRHRSLETLLRQLNPVLRGWCHYFRHGVSKATFGYLDAFAWRRVAVWLRKQHKRADSSGQCVTRLDLRRGSYARSRIGQVPTCP